MEKKHSKAAKRLDVLSHLLDTFLAASQLIDEGTNAGGAPNLQLNRLELPVEIS